MVNKTALYEQHRQHNSKMVDFHGWTMPLHYGSQMDEHHAVRTKAGMFDVSHMTIVDVTGSDALWYLQRLLINDVARLKVKGKAQYSALLNEQGGVIDDVIVYLMTEPRVLGEWFRVVFNCATREKVLQWMSDHVMKMDVVLTEQPDLAIIAVQGPQAIDTVLKKVSGSARSIIQALEYFQGLEDDGWFFARTGYTGEEGLEIMLPDEEIVAFWDDLISLQVQPCGLGARDTLRLEAGMNLSGQDMHEQVTPLESGMGWVVAWLPQERDFIGRSIVEKQRNQQECAQLIGLVLEEQKGILRSGQRVYCHDVPVGEITSGSFSPTLGFSIALARIENHQRNGLEVELRGKRIKVKAVKPPFVKKGVKVYS